MYLIKTHEADSEKEWLNSMQVYPAMQTYINWVQDTIHVRVGVIVSEDTALAIKLRHPLQFQAEYRQK
jgi:hypothetical protein